MTTRNIGLTASYASSDLKDLHEKLTHLAEKQNFFEELRLWGCVCFFFFFFKWLFFILPHFKDLAPSKSWFSDISHFVNKTLVSSYKHSDGTCAPVFRWGLVTAGLWKNPFYKPYKPASRMGFYQWKGHWSSEIVNSSQNLRPSRCWSFQ
jgi:hypothetical protein